MIIPHTLCGDDCRNNAFQAITSEQGYTSETAYDQNLFNSVITEAIEIFHRGCNSTGQERTKHVPTILATYHILIRMLKVIVVVVWVLIA